MRVPFIDLAKINARFESELAEAYARVARSGRYLFGPETETFEREFASWNGSAHCVAVANGLDALRLTLRAWLSLGQLVPGDEVVVPTNSFIASALAVSDSGLRVRLADVSPDTFNMTFETLRSALTERTRAVMPVHLYGQLADVEEIQRLCRENALLLLEDAAQAHGAKLGALSAGCFGGAGTFSFYPVKNLGALSDAGCVVTDDPVLAERVRLLGNYGSSQKYEHDFCGLNSRIDELQAAILTIKLKHLDRDNARRREIAQRYCEGLSNPLVHVPARPANPETHVWHLFVITTRHRMSLIRHLEAAGVGTVIHYPRVIHQQGAYRGRIDVPEAPIAERLQHEVLSLPLSQVMDDAQADYVIDAVNSWQGPSAGMR
jgi:dTDP-4-amino-4,6-dideoxygalactose transaminase